VLVSTHYMDEAERCHRLAYLAYGRLLAQGSAADIVEHQGLTTWEIAGEDLSAIAVRLRSEPGVEQVAAFGATLHVTGSDAAALEATIRRVEGDTGCRARPTATGLEDVFIHLTEQATDNYGTRQ
ncbi:MAG: ABC transporter ATP-binding protein, partial [Burkholderiales bacterium]